MWDGATLQPPHVRGTKDYPGRRPATACWVGHIVFFQILERVESGTMSPDTV